MIDRVESASRQAPPDLSAADHLAAPVRLQVGLEPGTGGKDTPMTDEPTGEPSPHGCTSSLRGISIPMCAGWLSLPSPFGPVRSVGADQRR